MTDLSVNLNKIALLRNSRGRNYPSVLSYAEKFIHLGVQGITIHPRPDERHIKYQDAYELATLLKNHPQIELNIEGYPSTDFLELIKQVKPHQCTLVPDAAKQLTSDHGWDFHQHQGFLTTTIQGIKQNGVRVAVFLDPDVAQVELAAKSKADRIELYTESYAKSCESNNPITASAETIELFRQAAAKAQDLGLGVNAGHDLCLHNLTEFLRIKDILEVSIGHALIIECLEQGIESVVSQYLAICK